MNTTHKIPSKRFLAVLGVVAAAAATPALLFAGAGTAHADDPCAWAREYSFYCSPGAGALNPEPVAPAPAPSSCRGAPAGFSKP